MDVRSSSAFAISELSLEGGASTCVVGLVARMPCWSYLSGLLVCASVGLLAWLSVGVVVGDAVRFAVVGGGVAVAAAALLLALGVVELVSLIFLLTSSSSTFLIRRGLLFLFVGCLLFTDLKLLLLSVSVSSVSLLGFVFAHWINRPDVVRRRRADALPL